MINTCELKLLNFFDSKNVEMDELIGRLGDLLPSSI